VEFNEDLRRTRSARFAGVERVALAAAFLLYAVAVAVTVAHHEPWRDEADVWLVARDASLPQFWSYLGHAGHPGLWHLLLLPLARGGAPYAAMGVLNALIAATGVAVFLRRAPLPLPLKVLFPFGVVPLFEYGVIAKNYALSFALLVAVLALLTAQKKRPLATGTALALLANAHALSLGVAATLAAYWFAVELRPAFTGAGRPRRRAAAALAIAGAGILLSVAQLIPPSDQHVKNPAGVVAGSLVPYATAHFPVGATGSTRHVTAPAGAVAAALALAALVLAYLGRNRAVLAWYLASVVGMSAFFALKLTPMFRHASFYLLLTVGALWLARAREGTPRRAGPLPTVTWVVIGLSFLVSAGVGVRRAALDVRLLFSASREAADLLDRVDPAGNTVVLYRQTCGEAVVPYLDGRLVWYPEQADYGTYLPWTVVRRLSGPAAAYERARDAFPGAERAVFVSCVALRDPAAYGLQLRAATGVPHRDFARDERYFLYSKTP
jgi:hypothetical protein